MAHLYEVGTRVWQADVTEGWMAADVVKKRIDGDKVVLVCRLINGEVRTFNRVKKSIEALMKTPE